MTVNYHGINNFRTRRPNSLLNISCIIKEKSISTKFSDVLPFAMFITLLFASMYFLACSIQSPAQQNIVERTVEKYFVINFDNTNQTAVFSIMKFNRILHQVHLSNEFGGKINVSEIENGIVAHGVGQDIKFETVEDSDGFTLIKVSRSLNSSEVVCDCFELFIGKLNWYGGTESVQNWPIEKSRYESFPYLPTSGVAERYWLHSGGGFIYVDDQAPLFVDQNIKPNKICLKVQNALPYNTRRDHFDFVYYLGLAADAKQAQVKAAQNFLNRPTNTVDRRMVEHPIWSTWARYKKNISEEIVRNFAAEIRSNGFNNSQIEIDDYWEQCYGSMTFDTNKFPNISNLVNSLKGQGFRVTLWSHPFINKGCEPWYSEAKSKRFVFSLLLSLFRSFSVQFSYRYLVSSYNGSTDTTWWDSDRNGAGAIDYTKSEAADWFLHRLEILQAETGIDSFKFDAGDTAVIPSVSACLKYMFHLLKSPDFCFCQSQFCHYLVFTVFGKI